MKLNHIIIIIIFIFLNACDQPPRGKVRTETLEIYSTSGNENNKEVDSLRYYESTEYRDNKIHHIAYYDDKGNLTGRLSYVYYNDQLINGRYEDPNGKLLSYYDFITDRKQNIIAEYGFDAATNELLSVKTFAYNKDGSILKRRLINADHTLEREYTFSYDAAGNELSKRVTDGAGEEVMIESFQVSEVDSTGAWMQRWGMVNNVPYTFYKRS